jgi:hypothetical protein
MRRFCFDRFSSPLLYTEWLLLSIGLLRQFCWPADALSILMSRRLAMIEPTDQNYLGFELLPIWWHRCCVVFGCSIVLEISQK